MKKEVIISAKTVEEAVALAVAELGAPSADKIEYTVIEEAKKGFLGIGAKDAMLKVTVNEIKDVDLHSYDMIVFFNPADVKSLYENYPEFEQKDIKFVSYGRSIVKAMEEAGLKIEISAPTPEAPSVAKALEIYLTNNQ